ncbi:MAG: tetratricopeptide repeat protein [Acidobacteriota bacterium]|nr:tetratricopeptide repeat protein [Acidobacteriota bacterium]
MESLRNRVLPLSFPAFLALVLSAAPGVPMAGQEEPIRHSVAGRVLTQDGRPGQTISVVLSRPDGSQVGRKTVGYDGSFVFESLTSGDYLLTIERPDFASVGRPLEIRKYEEPRTVVLDIRLKGNESASFREVVKASGSLPSDRKAEEQSKKVSRKAGRAYLKASAAAAKGDRAKAIRHLQKAVKAQPEFFEAHYNLGVHYQALEQWENATRSYLRAIELRSNSARPNFNLGVIFHNQGMLDRAIQRYRQALEYDPSFAEAHQALGEARFQQGRHYAAEQHLETATRLAPVRAAPSFGLLVKIQLLNKDPIRAQFFLDQFLQHHPDAPIAPTLQKEIDSMLAANQGGP